MVWSKNHLVYVYVVLREIFRNLRANKLSVLVAIVSNAALFVILGVFLVLYSNLNGVVKDIRKNVRIIAYLKDEIQEISPVQSDIEKQPEVSSVRYTSSDAAMADFSRRFGNSDLLKGFQENPLPASLEIFIKEKSQSMNSIEALSEKLMATGFFTELQYGKRWLKKLNRLVEYFNFAVIIIFFILSFSIMVLISNITKLTLLMRREEVDIMKLIGATDTFIRIPFILEGAMLGLSGGLFSLILLRGIFYIVMNRFSAFWHLILSGGQLCFISAPYMAGILVAGLFIGATGAMPPLRNLLTR